MPPGSAGETPPAYARAGALPGIDGYFGREYPGRGPLEVVTRTYQIMFAPIHGKEKLGKFLLKDPSLSNSHFGPWRRGRLVAVLPGSAGVSPARARKQDAGETPALPGGNVHRQNENRCPSLVDLAIGAHMRYDSWMAKHTIMLPDFMVGREPRSIVWDDEAGTVEGDHSQLDSLREALAEPTPYVFGNVAATWTLEVPVHNPADFLQMLSARVYERVEREPLRSTLPPVFDGVEGTRGVGEPCPPGAVQ